LLITIVLSGCVEQISEIGVLANQNPLIEEKVIPIAGASGNRIKLINYRNATDPSWDELISFLKADNTDKQPYNDLSFVCSDFAEMLHNNAEANGIRAGFVGLDLKGREPHALNVFNTTDRGIVFVDCTGSDSVYQFIDGQLVEIKPENNDKIAYVMKGKEYGLISLDYALSPDYSFYEEYKMKKEEFEMELQMYNRMVMEYNRDVEDFIKDVEVYKMELGNGTIYDESEFKKLSAIFEELKTREEELNKRNKELKQMLEDLKNKEKSVGNYFWDSLGIVENIEIYW